MARDEERMGNIFHAETEVVPEAGRESWSSVQAAERLREGR